MRTRHSGCPRGVYVFQDYWKIRDGQRQPGIGLTETDIWDFSLFSLGAKFLSKNDRCKAVLPGRRF